MRWHNAPLLFVLLLLLLLLRWWSWTVAMHGLSRQ
jgi:hypothetical protein